MAWCIYGRLADLGNTTSSADRAVLFVIKIASPRDPSDQLL